MSLAKFFKEWTSPSVLELDPVEQAMLIFILARAAQHGDGSECPVHKYELQRRFGSDALSMDFIADRLGMTGLVLFDGEIVKITGALRWTQKRKPKAPSSRCEFKDNKFWVPDTLRRMWADAYRGVDIDAQLHKAAVWWLANPARQKKNIDRFLVNWLSRAQENNQPARPRQKTGAW